MEITAAVAYPDAHDFRLERVSLEDPRDDEVLVQVAGVGICHTDLVMRAGLAPFPFPAVFGHEGAGRVVAVGRAVRDLAVGDAVVMSFLSCGSCAQCSGDAPAYCSELMALNYAGTRPDGSATLHGSDGPLGAHFFCQSSFATHALARERNLVRVSPDLPLEILGPLGCGIQTGAGAVLRSLDLQAGNTLLVTGAGAVGLSAVMAARLRQLDEIIVIEPAQSRRQLAMELGATCALAPGVEGELLAAILERAPGGVTAAVDTSGHPAALSLALASLATRGVLGLVGSAQADTALPGHVNGLLSRGQSIRGIIEGDSDPQVFIPELLAYHAAGELPFDRMVRCYPFEEINEAVADLERGDTVKAVLRMPDPPQ